MLLLKEFQNSFPENVHARTCDFLRFASESCQGWSASNMSKLLRCVGPVNSIKESEASCRLFSVATDGKGSGTNLWALCSTISFLRSVCCWSLQKVSKEWCGLDCSKPEIYSNWQKGQPYQVQPVHLHPSAEIQWSPLQSSMRPALRLHWGGLSGLCRISALSQAGEIWTSDLIIRSDSKILRSTTERSWTNHHTRLQIQDILTA